jgi:hypothetical protein
MCFWLPVMNVAAPKITLPVSIVRVNPMMSSVIITLAMDEQLAAELLAMKAEDLRVRDELARDGSLFDGYHPRMEEMHRRNAARLREIIAERGWPRQSLVGQQATEAAWMIVQHDIAEPQFLRDMLEIFREEAARGELQAKWAALTEDRIRMYEGRPQLYATNMNWNERGELVVGEVEDPEHLDQRRADVGLPPFRDPGMPRDQPSLKNPQEFYRRYVEWLHCVGWR